MEKQSKYRFHHLGIPTEQVQSEERYSEHFKMYTSDHPGDFKIQFHRFEPGSPLHPLIKSLPHIAFQVDHLVTAIAGKKILLGPYEPIAGYKVAMVDDAGFPVELIETLMDETELWEKARKQKDFQTEGLESK